MIAFVRGTVAELAPDSAVVDVGGVGYTMQCAPATLAGLTEGAIVRVPTSLVVREDSMTLYGFADDDERAVFALLQTAGGVGPRLALAMLAVLTPDELRRAVSSEDWPALTAVPGIGKKGAQRICLELRDRLGVPASQPSAASRTPAPRSGAEEWRVQVHGALIGLGWSAKEAHEAVGHVADEAVAASAAGQPVDVPSLLRSALAALSRA